MTRRIVPSSARSGRPHCAITESLDVVNGGPFDHFVGLAPCGDFSGQLWTAREEGPWLRLANEFLGPDVCLDVFNGGPLHGMAMMAPCGDFSGQLWQLN